MMKKNIKKICLLAFVLIVISTIFIIIMGKTYTTSFTIHDDNYNFSLENETGEVKIIDKEVKDSKYIIKFKARKPGKAYFIMDYGDISET